MAIQKSMKKGVKYGDFGVKIVIKIFTHKSQQNFHIAFNVLHGNFKALFISRLFHAQVKRIGLNWLSKDVSVYQF